MIIIGTEAARRGNFLPTWRKDFKGSGDIDVVCSEANILSTMSIGFLPVFHKKNHVSVFKDLQHYEITGVSTDTYDLMLSLSPEEGYLNEFKVNIAPVEVVWATLYYTAGCVVKSFDKSFRDLFFYNDLVKERNLLTDQHWKLAQLYRTRMIEIIRANLEKNNDSN